VKTEKLPKRNLLELAMENAVEGCVKEAFAAFSALYQSRKARDQELRSALGQIAAEETGHAQLAWDLHAWFLSQLSVEETAAVEEALSTALRNLRQPPEAHNLNRMESERLGLPKNENFTRLVTNFRSQFAPFVRAA
jgi:Mn-containing catalase